MESKKYVKVKHDDKLKYGVIHDKEVVLLNKAPWLGIEATDEKISLQGTKLFAPVEPEKIICVGLNYHAHVTASQSADEAPKEPLLFFKPPTSVIGPFDNIVYPKVSERVDYEAELGIIIGKTVRNIDESQAEEAIFGFTCVNDVTARDLQKKDGQWTRAKGFDTFCPVGPWIVDKLDYTHVLVEGIHNDEIKQSGNTELMIFSIPKVISYISSIMTLKPGDLISTGTPAGIAPMQPGDKIVVRVEGIGEIENQIVSA